MQSNTETTQAEASLGNDLDLSHRIGCYVVNPIAFELRNFFQQFRVFLGEHFKLDHELTDKLGKENTFIGMSDQFESVAKNLAASTAEIPMYEVECVAMGEGATIKFRFVRKL